MKFEEDFPSLKGKRFSPCNDKEHFEEHGGHCAICPDGEFIHIVIVQEHCLDKQKVAKSFRNIRIALSNCHPDEKLAELELEIEAAEEELGL